MKQICRTVISVIGLLTVAGGPAAQAQDSMSLGIVEGGPGGVVEVPIRVVDTLGTALGSEKVFGKNVQAFSYQIKYSPAAAVASIDAARAGVMAALSPIYDATRKYGDLISHIVSINENAQRVSGLNPPAGGDVSKLLVYIAPDAAPGTVIDLTFVDAKTVLSNHAGTILETTANGNLRLTNGKITVTGAAGPPVVGVYGTDAVAAEKKRNKGVFTITRTGSAAAKLTCKFALTGTAGYGRDYKRLKLSIVLPAGVSRREITVTPIDDKVKEKTEKVILTLAKGKGYSIASRKAIIKIQDND